MNFYLGIVLVGEKEIIRNKIYVLDGIRVREKFKVVKGGRSIIFGWSDF